MGNLTERHIKFSHDVKKDTVPSIDFKLRRKSQEINEILMAKLLNNKQKSSSSSEENENSKISLDSSESFSSDDSAPTTDSNRPQTYSPETLKRVRIDEQTLVKLPNSDKEAFRKRSREFEKSEFTTAIKLIKQHIEIIEETDHKDSSPEFIQKIKEFEANEFLLAKKFGKENPIDEEETKKSVVFLIETEGHKSSESFTSRSRKFEKDEFRKARRLSMREPPNTFHN